FARPSNLLVMDEPTNDLDVETLELLEELLGEYPGTLLLVSHDRDFLDNVVTSTLVMPDAGSRDGRIREYVGGYSDWLRQRDAEASPPPAAPRAATVATTAAPSASALTASAKRKLSFKDARELEQLPLRIETLESQLASLTAAMNVPGFFQRDSTAVTADNMALADAQSALDAAYARWEALEGQTG
ncbi:MAG: ABC transporter ATP-binding protein, partial [Luteimonas sp.]